MRIVWTMMVVIMATTILTSCGQLFDRGQLNNVGLLVDGTIHDETWGKGAYLGVLNIKDEHNVSVITKENVNSLRKTEEYVKDMDRQGVNLIFGHGASFGKYFDQINEYYPNIHFVYFNGNTFDNNITSIHFDGYDMGYFAGVLSAQMTKLKKIAIISAFQNQPEVQGFFEGVKDTDPSIRVILRSVFDWYDQKRALSLFNNLMDDGIDVVYPAGDGFNVPIIEKASEHDIYSIGYINDQHDISPKYVLTSTIQDLEKLYLEIANQYNRDELPSGIISYGFDDQYVYLGKYGDTVPESTRERVEEAIQQYLKSGRIGD
ncbi:BMP family ABC transporter substrate-binding protein [Filobacillus milosensis]|uniref:BMP family ABC transporter substrate-binding protein n=1 Tax=Filobacillus milosensis TaxID=94137 RepID=A0A4Y8IL74_9BACI|nr:BMP family ABC transporter substrate-binding protein [Filobacillus milosensis]TFB22025.1 BMP family ABC transporter substrate-binding protein [Filobacillus milosensis]